MIDEDLKTRFPLSKLWLVKKNALLTVMFALSLFVVYQFGPSLGEGNSRIFFAVVSLSGLLVLFARISYLYLYMRAYQYRVVGDEILISRGVIMKTPVGIPISKINAIHIHRNLMDYILGTANIVIVVPGNLSIKLCRIEGLSKKSATNFKSYIFGVN